MTDPLSRRPATVADVPVVHRLIAACEESLHGEVTTSADRVAVELGEPGSEAVVVLGPEGEAAGWGVGAGAAGHGGRASPAPGAGARGFAAVLGGGAGHG
ncbi:hypothetical protein CQR58_048990 [Streptomyces acidiscabies]|uniref:hypothetical protein n=1 Tax=Streptomyces acidiscabies TaxID=42234 RepID=UPI0034C61187